MEKNHSTCLQMMLELALDRIQNIMLKSIYWKDKCWKGNFTKMSNITNQPNNEAEAAVKGVKIFDLEPHDGEPVFDEHVDVVHCCRQFTHVDLLRCVPVPIPGAIQAIDEGAEEAPTPQNCFAALHDCG